MEVIIEETTLMIINRANDFFDFDNQKVLTWLNTKNNNFGGISPALLIAMGKGEKVLSFMDSVRDGNIP